MKGQNGIPGNPAVFVFQGIPEPFSGKWGVHSPKPFDDIGPDAGNRRLELSAHPIVVTQPAGDEERCLGCHSLIGMAGEMAQDLDQPRPG